MVNPAAGALILQQIAGTSRQATKEGKKLSIEIFGFDFVSLTMKIVAWFFIAVVIDKIHWIFSSGTINVASTIASVFGYTIPAASNEPNFFKKIFNEGYFGLKYWDFIKIGALLLVFIEFMRYYENEKRLGGTPSPFTIGIFVLFMTLLSAFTVPEIINKLRNRTPNAVPMPAGDGLFNFDFGDPDSRDVFGRR